jgi:cell division septum initiation protein DivIVA
LSSNVAESLEGLPPARPEQAGVSPLLDDVAAAAERYARAQEERRQALEELRAKVRIARDEGISFAAIARAAGVSREYVRRLYAGR